MKMMRLLLLGGYHLYHSEQQQHHSRRLSIINLDLKSGVPLLPSHKAHLIPDTSKVPSVPMDPEYIMIPPTGITTVEGAGEGLLEHVFA